MRSRPSLPARSTAWLLAALAAAAVMTPVAMPEKTARSQTIPIGGPFSLTDHLGRPVRDSDFRGSLMLLTFGYTYCPDFCPTTLQVMSEAVELLGDKGTAVQPLFITVDPERDTVEALADYVPHFHPRFLGLTGSLEDLKAVVKAYRIHVRRAELEDADDNYLVDHSTFTYLMGRDGKFLTLFRHGTPAANMAEVMRKHLS